MTEIKKTDFHDAKAMEEAKRIRIEVFVKEQNVPFEEDWDGLESENYLAFCDSEAVGTMRWRETENKIKIEKVCVLKPYRGRKIAEHMLEKALEDIRKSYPGKEVFLHSQLAALSLYKRLGFKQYGELFYEAEIPHYAMRLEKE